MAATWVGVSLLSSSIQTLLDLCSSSHFTEFSRERKLDSFVLSRLKRRPNTIDALLYDAEDKENSDPLIAAWLDQLPNLVLDAQYVLDEINTASAQRSAETKWQKFTIPVRNILSSSFNEYRRVMDSKIGAIRERLGDLLMQGRSRGLQEPSSQMRYRFIKLIPSSFVDESVVVGRIDEKEKLMNMLLSDDDARRGNIGVVTIVGLPGVGKTTLAELLYDDERVQNHFDIKAWLCVSGGFAVTGRTKTLLESVTLGVYDGKNPYDPHVNLEQIWGEKKSLSVLDDLLNDKYDLQVKLEQILRGKKFLIVLDDLLNDKYDGWNNLRTTFRHGNTGSRVIITTSSQNVAEMTRTFPSCKLEPLSDKDCWLLLAKHAFGSGGPSRYPDLEVIAKEIAKKCAGFPSAVNIIGGVLRSNVDSKEWNRILDSDLWDLSGNNVLRSLRFSYPSQLKRCFAYCSIFPKDYLFDRKQLVLLWMAEGLVQEFEGEKKTMEEIGDGYFSKLLSRSLIHHAGGGMFVMDNHAKDLAAFVSRRRDLYYEGYDMIDIPSNVCHLSYHIGEYDSSNKFSTFYQLKYLRCFLPLGYNCGLKQHFLAKTVLYDLLPRLRCLRVLSLSQYYNITELPSSIGNLEHLRYLDLSYTAIKRLPDATCALHNLQTLLLSKCEFLTELPAQIGKLVNLRHLDITGTNLKGMPVQITKLQNLRTLTVFVVGKQQDGLRVRELRNFPHLQGKLSILKLQNVVDATDAFEANLKNNAQIEELTLEWDWMNDVYDTLSERDVLDQLQPSTNLRRLTISYYGGTSFPSWLGDFTYFNIVSLCINQCKRCSVLPPFGQLPSLGKLEVKGMASINTIGAKFYGSGSSSFKPFPVLKSLTFMCMPEWEEWIPFEGEGENFPFPCLERLCLIKCPKLRGYLPSHLPSRLIEVEISHCDQFEASALCQVSLIGKLSIVNGRLGSVMLLGNDSQCSVRHLNIEMCDSLPSLPEMFLSNNCLHHLCLNFIPSLVSFPMDGLPISLRSLKIWECKKLQFLPQETLGNYKSLERLELCNSCHSMISFPLGFFPALKYLAIISSTSLKFFTISETSAHHLFHLETLEISDCPNLESFPEGGLPTPSLVKLSISHCDTLKSLPECIGTLTALQDCIFSNLRDLTSFPQGGLPSNLRSLVISDIGRLLPMGIAEWGFQRLTSLSQVRVGGHGGDDILKALLEKQLLSTSLVSLCISNLCYIKFLEGYWLQQLKSLQKLHIDNCPRLESLPEDSLPLSLTFVSIFGCPILEARYQDRRREPWSKIARIPVIVINEEVII